eukprot:c15569_g1_i1 orf=273-1718(-)
MATARVMGRPQLLLFVLGLVSLIGSVSSQRVCIVGSGISGSSAAYFIRTYSGKEVEIEIYEKNAVVGGRMAMVELGGDSFEAGASIIHPKNYHAVRFAKLLGLKQRPEADSGNFGIWDGKKFIFKTLKPGHSFVSRQVSKFLNSLSLFWRYRWSLVKMQSYVSELLEKFLHYYDEPRPVFETVEEMLKWANLYKLTLSTSEKELLTYGLSSQFINELATVIMRINYGQNMSISGMAGAVSLCGSGENFWAVEGGNWQLAAGLIRHSNASVFVNETVVSVSRNEGHYEVGLVSGSLRTCDAVILATSLDENHIKFSPPISIPDRRMQHTFTTFVRGLINSDYFGISSVEKVPSLIGTLEISAIPFSSINVLKTYDLQEKAYKIFSRAPLSDELLDQLFRFRNSTIHIDWAAYPHFIAPEKFASFLLDGKHLYYINAFENAASTIETCAVASENVAKLVLQRLSGGILKDRRPNFERVVVDDL